MGIRVAAVLGIKLRPPDRGECQTPRCAHQTRGRQAVEGWFEEEV